MSFKFNPIAFISRRSSKVRAKTRSESADQTSLSQNDSDNEFQSPVVRSRTRPSKKISSGQDPKSFPSSSSIRAQVLASLRRTRSPKRKVHQTSVRAISVPPSTLENDASTHINSTVTSTAINDNCKVASVVSSKYGKRQTKECESPAPLAQDDCFELTDISDVESDPMHKAQTFQWPISDENKIQKTAIETMDDNESNTPVGSQSQSLENINIESNNLSSSVRDDHNDNKNEIDTNILSTYTYDSTDLQYESEGENSTENEYAIYANNNNYFDDDKSVTKLAVEYEIDYPIIDHADYDDVLSFSNETPKQFSLSSDNEEEHDTEEQDDESTKSIRSSMNQSLTSIKQPEEEEGENKENIQCDTRNVYQDEIDDRQYVRSHSEDDYYKYDDENQQSLVITIDGEQNIQVHETNYGEEIQEQENTDQYESSNDELSQGPFSLTKLTAHNSEWKNMRDNSDTYLTTPSIIITSASTESLMKINNENSLTPPMRPPPPPVPSPPSHSVSTPKRPSPPKELPPRPQNPQSTTTSQHDTSKKRRKKDKLFGLVDLGPLPSDPDPNFPFRSHFEKSVLPNPKKAIQRILRGETKAERRQRKEQQELNRLLKGPRDKTEKIIKLESSPHSKDWQEFQELTARIQSTVEESTSKIKALSSVYQTDDNQPTELKSDDIKPELELTENWANFDQIKTTSEENWANFDQSIATSNNHTESYSLDTDKNWANFQIEEDLDKNNLGNWADFNQTPTTTDQIIDIKELEQPDNWAVFEQLQTSEQFVSSKPVESIGENWADFNTLQAVNQYPSHTSLGDENWANFELIAANNSLPFDSTGDIFNKNTDRTELKSTDNLFGNFENINNLQEDLFEQHCQEKTSEGEAHRRDHETVEENLFDSHYIKDTENPQNFNQLETDQKFLDFNNYNSQHPPNLSHLDTSEIVFELGVRGSVPEDITNNYNILKDTEDLLVRKKSIDTFGSHYTVVANNLIDPNNTEHSEQIVEFNQTKQTGTGEHLNESGHSAIEIKSDFSQTESSDNYFVVDRSGTIENLFGCDYPLPEVKLYSQTVIDTTQQKTTGKNNLSSSSKTIESKFDCNNSQIDIKTNSPESYFFLIDHQKLIQEKLLTTCSYFSKPHILQLNFKNMEADKLNRFNELDDNEVVQSNPIMDISEENYHNDYDIEHGNYEQNDDFDPEITADSSSDTSSYEDNEQHAVKENEDEIEGGEEGVEIGSKVHSSMIGEYDLGYHQHYDNTDYTDEEEMIFTTNAQNIKDNKEEINPFANDDFGDISIITTTTTIENKNKSIERKTSIDELKTIARPRVKPVRQETLSGNNPFRKRSDIDEPDMLNIDPHITDTADISTDELTRIASGIKLISPQNKISLHSKIKDSFDSNTSESFNGEVEVSKDELQNSEIIQTIENVNVNLDGFDPLQTIYPDSEDENSSHSNESRTLHITINQDQQQNTAMKSKSTVVSTDKYSELPITIQPPPQQSKSMNILDFNIESISNEENKMITEEDNHSTNETNANISPTTPPGWVDFFDDDDINNNNNDNNNNSNALSNVTAFKLDKDVVDKAFEIQLEQEDENNRSKPEPSYPEPPRPETPDPELDIPFHPFVNTEDTWRLWLRYPEKKTRVKQISKYTTDRYWREVAVRLIEEHGRKVIALHEIIENTDKISPEPYRTVRIEPYMQLSREKLQQYDKYGKLHVFKLNHVSYKELVGMRPEKFSIKNLQNLVTHKPKQNITLDHIPIYTEILKFGSLDQSRIRRLMPVFEDALMKIPSHKDTSLNYSREEVCCYVVDEYEGKLNVHGTILEQKARTRIFCTAFVNGGPHIVLGLNDKWRFGREVVRRSDILPVMHDEWINIQKPEFHSCVQMDEYEKDHMLQFYPLDGCRFELLRFRVSLRGNRELPMQVKVTYTIDGRRVSMRCDLLVPGYFSASKRSGAVPCEKVEINIPFPEEWIYHFRVEKHHKYGSVHSTLRKPGKIKGLERITQMAQSLLPPSMLEASIGVAKYEHLYKAIVWRIPRVPEKSEASFRPHLLTCNLVLAPHDTVPEWETLIPYCQIEYTMPSSTVSGATVRSISVEHTGNVEKFVKYLTKYKYTMDIDYQLGSRKEPVLKSLLDENTSSLYETSNEQTSSNRKYEQNASNNNISDNNNNHAMESEEYHRVNNVTTVISDEAQTNQTAPTEFGDLLGLGAEFDIPSDVRSEQSKSSNTDNIF